MSETLDIPDAGIPASRRKAMERAFARERELRAKRIATEIRRRAKVRRRARGDWAAQQLVQAACAADVCRFVEDWLWTYDPRNVGTELPTKLPFQLWPTQRRLLRWLDERVETMTSGLVEKSRAEGFSFTVLAWALHRWLFVDGFSAAVGSRKEGLVDDIGNLDALFPKFRYMLYSLPAWFLPKGFKRKKHDNYLRIVNPETGASITGEGGDNMGRGGRASVYIVDEWAFVEHQDAVNAAISQNSNVRIKGSTPNGVGDKMYEERFSGRYPVFTMHWRENPTKNFTAEYVEEVTAAGEEVKEIHPWYEKQKDELDPVTLAQEVDIDYAASAEGVVIPQKWVQAAIGFDLEEGAVNASGLDVAGSGKDKDVYSNRRGGVVRRVEEITGQNPVHKASDVEQMAKEDGADSVFYDRLGVGEGMTATLKSKEDKLSFDVIGIANSDSPTRRHFEDQPKVPAAERFADYAAELWWALRIRFWKTWQRAEGIEHYPDDECISIPNVPELVAQLSQPTYTKNSSDKIKVDKTGNGTKSPDHAESCMYSFAAKTEIDYARP